MDKFIEKYYKGSVDKGRYNNALNNAAIELGVPGDWLSAIFYLETAFSMNPYENRNPFGVGLIQFTDVAINQMIIDGYLPKGFVKEDIKKYSIEQAMNMVVDYFKMNQKRYGYSPIQTLENMYMLVFWPLGVSKPDSYILETKSLKAGTVALQNPVWDVDKDGKITAGEIRNNFRKKMPFTLTASVKNPEIEAVELKKKKMKE